MFSGLIEHRGVVEAIALDSRGGLALTVAMPSAVAQGIEPKDSIAVNGVCLTAVAVDGDAVRFDVVPETIDRSTLGALAIGDELNIELSLRVGERIGGHFVYGHVDATARVLDVVPEGQGVRFFVELPARLRALVIEKGYISIDGVSLTVAAVESGRFAIALIPETLARTTLGRRTAGSMVNLEVDPIARYIVGALELMRVETSAAVSK